MPHAIFQNFKTWIEKQFEYLIRAIRIDNGLEYISN
uniref:Retrovirus-related Pol polyprotein from transposon TNT 1-94 n=1 Tax=Rhizophora mucronata TaxID=61149 RepID=A0A2P2JV46_RHIMU